MPRRLPHTRSVSGIGARSQPFARTWRSWTTMRRTTARISAERHVRDALGDHARRVGDGDAELARRGDVDAVVTGARRRDQPHFGQPPHQRAGQRVVAARGDRREARRELVDQRVAVGGEVVAAHAIRRVERRHRLREQRADQQDFRAQRRPWIDASSALNFDQISIRSTQRPAYRPRSSPEAIPCVSRAPSSCRSPPPRRSWATQRCCVVAAVSRTSRCAW